MLRRELDKHRVRSDFDTLTTNNDPYSLKQEIQDLHIMIDEVEQERDEAKELVARLQDDLMRTKEILQNNQLNLIDPLQNKIIELEKMVNENEADIKKRYKRKLRKYKREIELEQRINAQLKDKLSRHQSKRREESLGRLYNLETSSYNDENEDVNIGLNKTK